jgi:Fe-S cluster assembly protein SufD
MKGNMIQKDNFLLFADENVEIVALPGQVVEAFGLFTEGGQKEVDLKIFGENVRITFTALVLLESEKALTLRTSQIHRSGGSVSDILVKSVLKGRSDFQFTGKIRIEKKANKSDAFQRNDNLIIGAGATARSEPQLEILAHDVRCTHAATTRPVSEDVFWYLMTRGIKKIQAGELEAAGFVRGVLDRTRDSVFRSKMEDLLKKTSIEDY